MASSPHSLSSFQSEVLRSFFERENGFFLTGGGALVGFYLHHRSTDDLDLFTTVPDAFERGPHALADAAAQLGAELEVRQQSPGFHRYFVHRGDEAVVVDLVLDRVPQIRAVKESQEGIAVDSPEEILANKLTTLASRSEIRDLVDVMTLEHAGYSVDDALDDALAKDGGCTPATLAWVLSEVEISNHAELPGEVEPAVLKAYLNDLVKRLRIAAVPGG
jgi:predicted nucleotidyltransferase component of viral defense system